MEIKIIPNEKGNPPGKLADAELHFNGVTATCESLARLAEDLHQRQLAGQHDGYGLAELTNVQHALRSYRVLDGLKLIGFGIWERHDGKRTVTFPARQYSVNGERRSFALLRAIADVGAQERIRDLVLQAYAETAGGD